MSPNNRETIERFRKMATDDPTNELAHFRLGRELMEAGEYAEAIESFKRTLELSPQFSRVYQLLGQCYLSAGQREQALGAWKQGFEVADERGDLMPRDEMAALLTAQGEPAPVSKRGAATADTAVAPGGFRCQRPTCMMGSRARQLPRPPFNDELGQRIHQAVCADCWNDWLRNYSIKVINELRLDLSTEHGQAEYDRYMREFLGLD
jgi:tetratricopeptide (TPR) repeat protein